ncbi:TPA: hypothetical protein DCQ44_03545 [Candidatus Taylorbacteria bacterium]|nr:hypothetical protein [Candidatus Taylorbacteria bacterium]
MKIKKIGHCCLLIKTNDVTILTDPGTFSTEQNSIKDIDLVLITHEHADHMHIESVKEIIKNNPSVKIITNSSVGKKLEEAGIPFILLEGSAKTEFGKVSLEAFDCKHGEIFEEIGQVQNTGYFIDNKLFYPGDSIYFDPKLDIEVMALPVAGPWCMLADAIRYALAVKPKKVFPVHEAMLRPELIGLAHNIPKKVLGDHGIEFVPMIAGDEHEF